MHDTNTLAPEGRAAHVSGAHLAELLGGGYYDDLAGLVGEPVAEVIREWHSETFGDDERRFPTKCVGDMLAVPTAMVAEVLADNGVTVPTRAEVREWAEADAADGGDGIDPEVELMRAAWVFDPDIYDIAAPGEKRINGIAESVFTTLSPPDQAKVARGRVIAGPQSPTFVARWLVRNRYTVRWRIPQAGSKRRARVYMPTLRRIGQTWYQYTAASENEPAKWVARPDPEWMRSRLRAELSKLSYVKIRKPDNPVYELKNWNPDTRTLAMVEEALADLLHADTGAGTAPRELPDAYGRRCRAYPAAGTWVLCRNGVVDLNTGTIRPNTPLWFSLTMVDADYDHAADPYADTDWLRMLREQWGDDPGAITGLQQWFGYVLSGRTDLQKWMLVTGPSGSGKSIIAAVLSALMGSVAATTLKSLNTHFGLEPLYTSGAQLAVMGDIRFNTDDSSTAVESMLKVTGEDEVDVNRKHKMSVSTRLKVRFHASANEIPRFSDSAAALEKRALLLETSRGYRDTPDEDTGLKDRILANELGAVLRWAVEGLRLLNAAGGRFSRSTKADELAREMNDIAAPVGAFVRECCETGEPSDFVDAARLFEIWGRWAGENKTGQRMSKAAFQRTLKTVSEGAIKASQRNTGQRVVWGVRRAEVTYRDRDRFGVDMPRTLTTDADGDPFRGRESA